MGVLAAVLIGLIACLSFHRLARTTRLQIVGEMINHVPTTEKAIALTYDDGPSKHHTSYLLNTLEVLKVKATFFLIGKNIELYPHNARLILEQGHELGNHSYSHCKMVLKSRSFIRSEIRKTDDLLHELGVKKPIHFRAPFGYKRLRLPMVLAGMQRNNILWDIDTHDYMQTDAQKVVDNIYAQIQPGSIVLMHDQEGDSTSTIAITQKLVRRLRQDGYQFKTVSELMQMQS